MGVRPELETGNVGEQRPPWYVVQFRVRGESKVWKTVRSITNGPPHIWLTRDVAEGYAKKLDKQLETRILELGIDYPTKPLTRRPESKEVFVHLPADVHGRAITWQCEGTQPGATGPIPCSTNATVKDEKGLQWCDRCRR